MSYPKLAALSVLLRGDHVLLVRRKHEPDAGLWGFPGGHVEFGERVRDAACRELREETTIEARPVRTLIGLDTIIPAATGGTDFHFYLVAVECSYVCGEPQAQDDVSEAAWISLKDALGCKLPLSKDVDTVLKLALSGSPLRD